MSKTEKSLLDVREWKDKCRIETKGLSNELYIKKIRNSAKEIMEKYNFSLRVAK